MYEDDKAREMFTQKAISAHIESRARKCAQKILCESEFLFLFFYYWQIYLKLNILVVCHNYFSRYIIFEKDKTFKKFCKTLLKLLFYATVLYTKYICNVYRNIDLYYFWIYLRIIFVFLCILIKSVEYYLKLSIFKLCKIFNNNILNKKLIYFVNKIYINMPKRFENFVIIYDTCYRNSHRSRDRHKSGTALCSQDNVQGKVSRGKQFSAISSSWKRAGGKFASGSRYEVVRK